MLRSGISSSAIAKKFRAVENKPEDAPRKPVDYRHVYRLEKKKSGTAVSQNRSRRISENKISEKLDFVMKDCFVVVDDDEANFVHVLQQEEFYEEVVIEEQLENQQTEEIVFVSIQVSIQ